MWVSCCGPVAVAVGPFVVSLADRLLSRLVAVGLSFCDVRSLSFICIVVIGRIVVSAVPRFPSLIDKTEVPRQQQFCLQPQ